MTDLLPMDLHSHSECSPDAQTPVVEMCAAAIQKKIAVYAITDHYDLGGTDSADTNFDQLFAQNIPKIQAAKTLYADQLRLLTGIELGQPMENPAQTAKAAAILAAFPFDFVLGSQHNAPGRPDFYFYNPRNEAFDLEKELSLYFTGLLEVVRWGRFDSAAHLTYPFRYILRQGQTNYNFRRWDDHLEAIVRLLAEKGLALEINTSGVSENPSYLMPETRWVQRFRELGGERLTIGADAHSPDRVGAGIRAGMAAAAKAGFRRLCYYAERQPYFLSLADFK
ncbi:MAG: histidinol-phosphatase HisJ family protein [Peptococcaceae bacterium]|nr:histidinol-phosphatase HisJ family protein [Peptococcaceae bacterium]